MFKSIDKTNKIKAPEFRQKINNFKNRFQRSMCNQHQIDDASMACMLGSISMQISIIRLIINRPFLLFAVDAPFAVDICFLCLFLCSWIAKIVKLNLFRSENKNAFPLNCRSVIFHVSTASV